MISPEEVSGASTATLLRELRTLRLEQRRDPHLVLLVGTQLEQRNQLYGGNPDQWDALEQVVVAAVEAGDPILAETLLTRLDRHFRESQPHRSAYLHGLLLEARGDLGGARSRYEANLRDDETDVPSRKRLIALHLSSPLVTLPETAAASSSRTASSVPASHQPYLAASLSQHKGIHVLVHYLDTYYTDLAGWLALAAAYTHLALYAQALAALAHALVLAPHDPWVALRYAETAYTAGQIPLAWKQFLRAIEISTEPATEGGTASDRLQGAARRAAMGAKLCLPRLRALEEDETKKKKSTSSRDPVDPGLLAPVRLDEVDLLLSKLLLGAYHHTDGAAGTGIIERWLSSTSEEAAPR